jgi:hypothetical protein
MEEQFEEQELPSKRGIGLKYGAIAGLLGIIQLVVLDFAGMTGNNTVSTIVGLALSIVVIILAHKEFKDSGDGMMNYGEGVNIGVWMGLIGALISAVFLMVYVEVINPGYMEMIEQQSIMQMEERGLSDREIEQAMEMSSAFRSPAVIAISALIGGFIGTLIISLIISAFTKKSRPEFA